LIWAGLHSLGFPFSASGFWQVCFGVGMTILLGVAARFGAGLELAQEAPKGLLGSVEAPRDPPRSG
jgi:hypothetical protein